MKTIYNKLFAYVTRDVSKESESNNLVVLLRIHAICDFFYHGVLSALFFGCVDVISALGALLFAIIQVFDFYMTYKRNSRSSLLLYCLGVAASTVFYCQYVSPGLGFRYVIFTIIPLIYFKTDESWNFRIFWSTLVAVFSITLAIVGLYASNTWTVTNVTKIILIVLTTLALAFKLMIISHFYYKKFSSDELKIIKYSQKLEKLATQDPLTKLQNRRGMINYLNNKVINSAESGGFTVSMADIDYFKSINDTYGHEAGDYVLQTVSTIMEEFMNGKGHLARWGGEEFLLVFDLNGDEAFVEVESLRRRVEFTKMSYADKPINITMTFGLEEYSPSYEIERTIDNADKKLYQGKTEGRNRVIY